MNRPTSAEIPDKPGAYLWRDRHGQVLYVGKAKSLRKRIASYFAKDLQPRTRSMVDASDSIDWIVTDTEVAALMLEYNLIKEHKPRFNIRLKDDKSFPYLALTRSDEWPRAVVMRGRRRKGTQYFGPYAHAYAIRKTLDQLLKTFPVRTCSDSLFKRQVAAGRPCLLFDIEKCSGPCIGAVTPDEYDAHLEGLAGFLSGRTGEVERQLERSMLEASESREYEQAARDRDRLADVRRATTRQEVATSRSEDLDVIAISSDELDAAVAVLHVRHGRIVGQRETVLDRVEDVTEVELLGRLLRDLYAETPPPRTVLVRESPADVDVWSAWLRERRGGPVEIRVPHRGAKRRLLDTSTENAAEVLARHRFKRAADHNARTQALRSLQAELDLPEAPLRIEAFDISTLQGTNTVASMVVLEDGLPKRSDYRRFKIRTVAGQDDFASMEETIRRRFTAYLADDDRSGRFAYPPSLVVIDGGIGQLGRAVKVLDQLGIAVPVVGLAKRMEEVYLPGRPDPIRLPRDAEALYLLQRVRDEAHRFAVSYHRKLRSKSMVDSLLDEVEGVGPARKKALIRHFGSLKKMRTVGRDALAEVVPASVAAHLYDALNSEADVNRADRKAKA